MMRRISAGVCTLVMLFACVACISEGVQAAEPIRIALHPVYNVPSPGLRHLLVYQLHSRLYECPHVQVVSADRTRAILSELTSGIRETADKELFAAFNQYVPIDALVQFRIAPEGGGTVQIHTKAGIKTVQSTLFGSKNKHEIGQALLPLAGAVGGALGLPEADMAILTRVRIQPAELVYPCIASRLLHVRWPDNPAENALMMLKPHLTAHHGNAPYAARVLEEAHHLKEAKRREQTFWPTAQKMAEGALGGVLGTRYEAAAVGVLRDAPEAFQKELTQLAEPLLVEEGGLDALEDGLEEDDGLPLGDSDGRSPGATITRQKRLGALRLLGALPFAVVQGLIREAVSHGSADVRRAAAYALGYSDSPSDAIKLLTPLLEDGDPLVALAAAQGLHTHKDASPRIHAVCLQIWNDETQPIFERHAAATLLCARPVTEDEPHLRAMLAQPSAALQKAAWNALLRIGVATGDDVRMLLQHPDEELVIGMLNVLPDVERKSLQEELIRLANDPGAAVAVAARLALAPLRPTDVFAQQQFDVRIEHTYIRKKIADTFAASKKWDALEAVCKNPDAHTRAHALGLLAAADAKRAAPLVADAIGDPYPWVRLHAAALLSNVKESVDAGVIGAALNRETDPAIRLYLAEALGVPADGKAALPLPPARSVEGKTSLCWNTGAGADGENSPFNAYYAMGVNVNDEWKAGYAAGKIFFGRASPIHNPGVIVTDPQYKDRFWISLNSQVNESNLPWIDGLIYGEETMSMSPDALWETGWRLFCLDAGLDPQTIGGDKEKLSAPQERAWKHWALERCTDGFNMLYDYTKLRQGKLRPGLQVGTFMVEQMLLGTGPNPADRRWKFDVAGIYDYKGCNRIAAYFLTRRIQTLWPTRPIIWLSLGIGGYEMNPVRHTQKTPAAPMLSRGVRCYRDNLSAWLAGADPGFFSTWIFVSPKWKGSRGTLAGVQITVEDILPDSDLLRRGIEYAFAGVEPEDPDAAKLPESGGALMEGEDEGEEITLEAEEDSAPKEDPIAIAKETMRQGFLFYGQYVYDCARVLRGLPRMRYNAPFLLVRPNISVWTRSSHNADIPGFALVDRCDFLCDINKVAGMDLSRYRMIAVTSPGYLRDETIRAITEWLRTTPGVLYVHGNLSADNAAEASTPEDMDGKLEADWPWEASVQTLPREAKKEKHAELTLQGAKETLVVTQALVRSTFNVTGKDATAVLKDKDNVVLALWRNPSFKGAVVFDGLADTSAEYLAGLRKVFAGLQKEKIGEPLPAHNAQQHGAIGALYAATASGYHRNIATPEAVPGIDMLTGMKDPEVSPAAGGALVATADYRGNYTIFHKGISVLAQAPLEGAKTSDSGVSLKTAGLVRISATAPVAILRTDGAALPEVPFDARWMFEAKTDGVCVHPADKTIRYARSRNGLRITIQK